ncbi:D-alanyl-D-alanine carboxypeptidase family protein [Paenarthrobacter ureafaciens]|uniref:M15 family metallopeptidase n=1 Tax=Paenarthrobacter TaxID=1742992 RepID=UPI00074D4798|nr:peptidase M15 [Arthrobacter sp. ATCC 21022]NKR10040.1 peptidase M15 [Arthrobacter sp. M5]NKR14657.1 peptidase M15 [Arthrobacter sp. M6]OEH60197.1 peptidase M15 [Arthrobacter sp. D4]OEH60812.1 peptidase M15 [Arthrobacter sp. D2]QMU83392.1 M15 family metallopeptidase [Paenarthrobacter ureafaciens]
MTPVGSTGQPSRRAFTGLLTAGAGLIALSACTPETSTPSPAAADAPTGTPSAAATTPAPEVTPAAAATSTPTSAASSPSPSGAAATQYSLTDPASPWVVVNKHRPLNPQNYVPADLVQPAVRLAVSGEASLLNTTTAAAAEKMFGAAAAEGVIMALASGYRSYSTQVATYNGYVAGSGQAAADRASARPGFSEHQTGWSFDISDGGGACSFQPCFAEQPAAVWAKANAYKFGFVVRYPWMFHEITGYFYESWHLRYIGVEAATAMATGGIATLEEYFGLEAAPDYL